MRTRKLLRQIGALCFLMTVFCGTSALAVQADTFSAGPPPQGWRHLCTGNSIHVTPAANSRTYTGSGTCWVLAPSGWVIANVTLMGAYRIKSNQFSERLTFAYKSIVPTRGGGSVSTTVHPRVMVSGVCARDPWETTAKCTTSGPNVDLNKSFGWAIRLPAGPLSRNVFGAGLIQALLSKQVSRPPLSPVDLDAVRWPASDGKGTIGRVFWRVPDVSGNRWILEFEIEASMNSSDSAFFKVGRVTGPGATMNLSPGQISKYFWTPSKLQAADYYFRVCSVNDVGRSCSAPAKAREPTQAELMTTGSHRFTKAGLGGQPGGSPKLPTSATGTHIALGTAIGGAGRLPNTTRAPSVALGGNRGMPAIGPEKTMSASGSRPIVAGATPAASRALGAAAGRPGSAAYTAAPNAVLPDVLLEGGGVNIGSTYLPYVSSGPPTVHSSVMINSPNGTRGVGCRFPVSFKFKNMGGAPTPSSFDVYFRIIKGPPFVMGAPAIASLGFSMNQLNPGGIGSENSGFDLLPGNYGFYLTVDPHHRFKQAGPSDRGWLFAFKVTCGNGVFAPRPGGVPAGHVAAPGAASRPGSNGSLPAQPRRLRR